jgi:predicted nucleic acid-binding protein
VFAYPKFRLTDAEITYLIEHEIRPWFKPITAHIKNTPWISEDPADDMFINAAGSQKGLHLISGDRHIIDCRNDLPVSVLTVHEALDRLMKE